MGQGSVRELFDIFGAAVLHGGLFGLLVIGVGVFLFGLWHALRMWRRTFRAGGAKALSAVAVALATMYGGSKIISTVTVDDPYIVNAGSYITNDVIHVSIAKKYDFLPDTMEILVFVRDVASTNVEDWTELLPRHTFADSPFEIWLANATNFNALVAADYVPEPTVHTNGVWQIKGFIVPGTTNATATGIMAFPNTKEVIR